MKTIKASFFRKNKKCYLRKENRIIYLKFYNSKTVGGRNLNKKYKNKNLSKHEKDYT